MTRFQYRIASKAIADIVAAHFDVEPALLFDKTRKQPITEARHAAVVIMKGLYPGLDSDTLAWVFNRKDHSTVNNSHLRVSSLLEVDPEYALAFENAKQTVENILSNV